MDSGYANSSRTLFQQLFANRISETQIPGLYPSNPNWTYYMWVLPTGSYALLTSVHYDPVCHCPTDPRAVGRLSDATQAHAHRKYGHLVSVDRRRTRYA